MPIPLPAILARTLTLLRPPVRRGRRRLRVEPLEDRSVPAAQLAITPITWDAIGLDSNNVAVGPNQYLVGARVTNTGDAAATNVTADFTWDTANAFINLTDASHLTLSSLAAGAHQDFFFNVTITRNAAAYNTTRQYHISAQADGLGPVSTPNSPTDYRQLFVEKLLSQNRNSVLSFTGPSNVTIGQTVTYTLTAKTSTAYPQLDVFSGFDNRIFQIQSVGVTYDNPAGDTNDTFYANATIWGANPVGASYNTTTSTVNPQFPGGKVGGNVVTTVTAKIIGSGSTTLFPTINDFSGSSFHYNADYAGQAISISATSPAANLHLTKAVDNPAPNVGDTVTYTVTLADLGPNDATGVQVTDRLPAGLSFLSAAPSQGTYDATTGVWAVGTVANGAIATLTVTARVTAPAATTNTAQVTASDLADPDPSDNSASATVTPKQADLHLTKTVSNPAPNVGGIVTFDLSLSNTGPDSATNVRVSDQLPAGLAFVSSSPSQGSYDPATGVWAVGSLAGGATADLLVQAQVTSPNAVTNTATVTSDVYDPNPADNTGAATVTPQRANLGLAKSVSNATPNVGDTVTYTVTLRNQGPNDATDVLVQDALPVGLTFVSAGATVGTYDSTNGVWTVGTIATGSTAILTITATVTGPGATTNFAQVTASDQYDPDPTDNSASATVTPQRADLSLTKSVDNATPNVGDTVTFTVNLANAGPDAATGVAVSDLLPAGLTFVSANPSQGSYDPATGTWAVGTVANGGTAALTLTAIVARPDAVTNLARVSAADQYDPDTSNNAGTATVTPKQADLAVTKTVDNATPLVGDTVTFTVRVVDNGPDAATGVVVSDVLPAGLQLSSFSPSQGSYDPVTGAWTVGTLANGAAATLTLSAVVNTSGNVTNVAGVTARDEYDPNTANDTGSATLTASPGPTSADLGLTKAVDNATPNVGDTVTFTVTLTDAGPDPATGVVVSDPLPAGLTFVSANPSHGTYDPGTGTWSVGAVDMTGSPVLTITAVVTSPNPVTNIARVTASSEPDPNSGNDAAAATVTPRLADLHLTKTVDNAAPNVGDTVTFTVAVMNQGPDDATGVRVTDQLPAGLSLQTATPTQGSYDPAAGVWTVGTVPNAVMATLTIASTVTDPAALTNFARITASDVYDPDTADNTASATVTPPRADLSVTKTVDNARPNVGDSVTFTVAVTSTGPDGATNVRLSDVLPGGLQYLGGAAGQGTYDPVSGVWAVGSLANGATASLTLTARVLTSQPLTNVAQVLSLDQYDPNAGNDRASATLSPAQADLSVSKTVDVANPVRNEVVTFTITLTNAGPDPATNVQVADPLPSGLVYQSSAPSQGSYDPATGAWAVGTLAGGATATLTVSARATDPGPMTNVARVTAVDQFDPNPSNNQAQATVTGQTTDLAVSVTAAPTSPNVGGQVTFTVTLTNQGPNDATGVTVTDLLPPGITFVSAGPGAITYDPATGIWTVGNLPVGQTATLTLTGTVTSPGTYTDTAGVSGVDQFDTNASNNQSSQPVSTSSADLHLSKSVDNAAPNVGDTVTFTVALTNQGPDAATGVAVTDRLPAGLTFVSAAAGQGSYNSASGVWTVGTLANGAATTLTVVATVTDPAAVTNTATVTSSDVFDPNPGDNSGQATVTPRQADLHLTKSVDNAVPNIGDTVRFTLTVSNGGPDTATAVVVADQLPAGLTYTASSPTQGAYDPASGAWTVGDLSNGASATLTIDATVSGASAATNVATAGSPVYDPSPNDNRASATEAPQPPDLVIAKSHAGAFRQGDTADTYTLTVSNAGTGSTFGPVTVTDTLPAGLSPTAADSGTINGWTVTTSGQTVTAIRSDALAAGSAYPALTLTVAVAANAAPSITNTAAVAGGSEVNTANDTASDPTPVIQVADLVITKVHNGTFRQGDLADSYTLTVSNTGPGPTVGAVTVTDTLPAGLTPTAGNTGTVNGWTVSTSGQRVTATRTDPLAPGASYPALPIPVGVAANAPPSVTNTAAVSGGGELNTANDTGTDTAAVTQVADLTISKTHAGTFRQGDPADTFTLTVYNVGPGPTAGTVSVTDVLPTGLAPTAADTGTVNGWALSFSGQTVTATRSDALAAGDSYPPLVVTVAVAANAPPSVTNTATVAGGGELNTTNDSGSDTAAVTQVADLVVTKVHNGTFRQTETGHTYTLTVRNVGPGPTSGTVSVTDTLPVGLTPTAADVGTINGWTVTVSGQTVTATRGDVLTAGASYPVLTITVDVAKNAPASVTNTAMVAGGGELNTANDTGTDTTPILPPPVVIGQTLWRDVNGNGVLDPGEPGIGGVTVRLYTPAGTQLATAVTDGSGHYSFSNGSGASTPSALFNLAAVASDTHYVVRVDNTANFVGAGPLAHMGLTSGFVGGNSAVNSKARMVGGVPTIDVFTGRDGTNNRVFNFGFVNPRDPGILTKRRFIH